VLIPRVATGLYFEIRQLVATQGNDYDLDVMKRLTTATIDFKNMIELPEVA